MTITPKTTVHTLLREYPFLLDFLAGYHPEFAKLTNPVLRRTMGRLATLERASAMADIPLNQLMIDVAAAVERHTGTHPGVADNAAAGGVDPERLATLKQLVQDLHAGHPMEELTARFEELIEDVEAGEIAAMEQQLIEEGMPVAEVKRLCDVHVRVFSSALDQHDRVKVPAGHPVHTFQRENDAVLRVTEALRGVLAGLRGEAGSAASGPDHRGDLLAALEALRPLELHYVRKENQLFPFLERHGIQGPSQVMWGLHDDIRAALKDAVRHAEEGDAEAAAQAAEWLARTIDDMVTKEEQVLFPMSMETLSPEEWVEIRSGEGEVGYAYLDAVPAWPAEGGGRTFISVDSLARTPRAAGPAGPAQPARLPLATGALTPAQVDLLLGTLKIDLSFVDENDEVRYYNEGERIFPRSPGVIGRRVQNCHPPQSVDKVQEIIDAFRAGEKDLADFWIQLQGRFVHIRYFAMRDADGTYRGTLETVQDVTEIRALQGERRLLDW